MDNITHSLFGGVAGTALAYRFPQSEQRFRKAVLWASLVGNNFPDIDAVTRLFTDKLGYLLAHRGYTHTFTLAPLEALAVTAIAALIAGIGRGLPRARWLALYGIGLASICLHIAADSCNDYGVHPFLPFVNRWYYGGFLFIVEPLIWAALLPYVVVRAKKWTAIALTAAFGALLFFVPQLEWRVSAFALLVFGFVLFGQLRSRDAFAPLATMIALIALFAVSGRIVESKIRAKIASEHPEERITQLVTTPTPGNFLCWRVIPVSEIVPPNGWVSGKSTTPIFERMGVVSLWPSAFPPRSCFRRILESPAPMMQTSLSEDEGVAWMGEFRSTSESLVSLSRQYCGFKRFLRFARAPIWEREGDELHATDLRYLGRAGARFAEFEFSPDVDCPESGGGEPSGLL